MSGSRKRALSLKLVNTTTEEQPAASSKAAPSFAAAARAAAVKAALPPSPATLSRVTLSEQQQGVLDWVRTGEGSAFVQARAGSGKTFTLVQAVRQMSGSIALTAFNKKIADELKHKLQDVPGVRVGTFHSFGFNAWRRVAKNVTVNAQQKDRAMMIAADVPKNMESAVRRLVSLGKQSVVGLAWDISNQEVWRQIIDHHSILLNAPATADDEKMTQDLIAYAIRGLHYAREQGRALIDFDDMLWLPLIEDVSTYTNDWVLVDESQDTNVARRMMAAKMLKPRGRSLWVGDDKQCQPAGTLVSVVRKAGGRNCKGAVIEEVPIESVEVGDRVVSYQSRDCAFRKNGARVRDIANRLFIGDLVQVIDSDGRKSRYTPDHRCLVNFSALRHKWAVYVMGREGSYRVGKCKMDYAHASGLSARMHHEKADAVWLLDVFDSEEEAFFVEQLVSAKYGLPQLMFNPKGHMRGSAAKYIPRVWKDAGNLTLRAVDALAAYGRDLMYPLFQRGTGSQQTIKRPVVTQACNLIDGVLVLPWQADSDVHVGRADWRPVKVSRVPYVGLVYSLDVVGGLYIADRIVTHNSIYGFAGADASAVTEIIDRFDCQLLPLTVTYRCSKAATKLAQQYVPDITAHESNRDGTVESVSASDFLQRFVADRGIQLGDAILCRNTRPLVDLAFRLIRNGIGCHVEGRDIGNQLETLVTRWKVKTVTELFAKLVEYRMQETERLMKRDAEHLIDMLNDRIETIFILADGVETVEALVAKIGNLFQDTDVREARSRVTLSTIHRYKGRESDRVFILGWGKYMPSKFAVKEWQQEQERNLAYVGVTRTRDKLFLVEALD